jgi:hypothetical protein
MAIYRATFFFTDTNGYGWSETFFNQGVTLEAVRDVAKQLVPRRVAILGRGVRLRFLRVSDDLIKRDSLIYDVPSEDGQLKDPNIDTSDLANTCVWCRLQATAMVRRPFPLAGIPDNVVQPSGAFNQDAAWMTAFQAWTNAVKNGGWAIKAKNTAVPQFAIVTIQQDAATGDITIEHAGANQFVQNDAIQIKGVRGATQCNGLFYVFKVTAPTFLVIKSRRLINPYTGGGTVGKVGFTLNNITEISPRRSGTRKRGRPFDSPIGRRRARKQA